MKFKCTSQGIYAFTIPVCHEEKIEVAESHLVDTVKENHKGYTQVPYDRAVKTGIYIINLAPQPWIISRDL